MTLLHQQHSSSEHLSPIEAARIEQQRAETAYRTLIDTTEQIRVGEYKPSRRTLRHLAHEAVFLASTEAISPIMTSDILAAAHANLRAAHVDTSKNGQVIADLSEQLLERAYPDADHNPTNRLRAEAIKWAIRHTDPHRSFESAHEIGWDRLKQVYGWEPNDDLLAAPPPDDMIPLHEPKTGSFYPFAEEDDEDEPPTVQLQIK